MVSAIIVAGGKGVRMGAKVRKQYLDLDGEPVLLKTVRVFSSSDHIEDIIVVLPETDIPWCKKQVFGKMKTDKRFIIIPGGKERQHSVYNGILALDAKTDIVIVHDGVRPFVTTEDISACIDAAARFGACILAAPARETLKKAVPDGLSVEQTLDRKDVWLAQTPQAFSCQLLRKAHDAARGEGFRGTDDASLVERMGETVHIVPGSRFNIKITTPDDLEFARAVCSMQQTNPG